ncbi:hypothetical protein K8I61_00820 [bacterium]|nr:hypothetical protein [bacterium]
MTRPTPLLNPPTKASWWVCAVIAGAGLLGAVSGVMKADVKTVAAGAFVLAVSSIWMLVATRAKGV